MKTLFDSMFVNYAEYSYFKQLTKKDRVTFFMELYEAELQRNSGTNFDLANFFASIKEQLTETPSIADLPKGVDYVEVMIDSENLMIESNSLKATRHIVYKFIESGYILCRDKNMEKEFKHDKITRYMRIYNIIDQVSCICTN
jgi:hypothetical protein